MKFLDDNEPLLTEENEYLSDSDTDEVVEIDSDEYIETETVYRIFRLMKDYCEQNNLPLCEYLTFDTVDMFTEQTLS